MDVPKHKKSAPKRMLKEKEAMRQEVLARRDAMDPKVRKAKSATICELLKEDLEKRELYEPGATIGVFSAFGSEVRLKKFAKAALANKVRIAYPVMIRKEKKDRVTMEFRKVHAEDLKTAPFIVEPLRVFDASSKDDMAELKPFSLCRPQQFDAIICPLVAFDSKGGRLGYGGGNYDRYLPWIRNEARIVGVAFEEQRVDSVPMVKYDIPIDVIYA